MDTTARDEGLLRYGCGTARVPDDTPDHERRTVAAHAADRLCRERCDRCSARSLASTRCRTERRGEDDRASVLLSVQCAANDTAVSALPRALRARRLWQTRRPRCARKRPHEFYNAGLARPAGVVQPDLDR